MTWCPRPISQIIAAHFQKGTLRFRSLLLSVFVNLRPTGFQVLDFGLKFRWGSERGRGLPGPFLLFLVNCFCPVIQG